MVPSQPMEHENVIDIEENEQRNIVRVNTAGL